MPKSEPKTAPPKIELIRVELLTDTAFFGATRSKLWDPEYDPNRETTAHYRPDLGLVIFEKKHPRPSECRQFAVPIQRVLRIIAK